MVLSELYDAVALCRLIEPIAAAHGFHVSLTGGCLYKDGPRKDIDIHIYTDTYKPLEGRYEDFKAALKGLGMEFIHDFGWAWSATYEGRHVDMAFFRLNPNMSA